MNVELFLALELLEREKGIPVTYMLEKVEAALVNAYKREFGNTGICRILLDPNKRDMKVYRQRNVVETVTDPVCEISLADAQAISRRHKLGGVVEEEVKTKSFRRLSAASAKSIIIQGIREAERTMHAREYEEKKEEIVSAVVDMVFPDSGDIRIKTDTSMEILPKSEQIPGETFQVGDHIKVFVMEVRRDSARGPVVTLSRTHPGMVKRLFELDVPELQDGVVAIKGIAREAGSRTKISVLSRDENVDAVGACIGARGSRINAVVKELRDEKIDVIKYSEAPDEYVCAALSPATVKRVELVEGERTCRVYVDPDQLSLAIGKEGQNARLAAKLTGYKIDIKTN